MLIDCKDYIVKIPTLLLTFAQILLLKSIVENRKRTRLI